MTKEEIKKLRVEVEQAYNTNYQAPYYRAVIVDSKGNEITHGNATFHSSDLAYSDGKKILDKMVSRAELERIGINGDMLWIDENAVGKYFGKSLILWSFIILGIFGIINLIKNLGDNLALTIFIIIAAMFTFTTIIIVTLEKWTANMNSYIIFDGNMYRMFGGNPSTTTGVAIGNVGRAVGGTKGGLTGGIIGLLLIAKGEKEKKENQQLLINGSMFYQLQKENKTYKILNVYDIIEKKGSCKIICRAQNMRNDNIKEMKFVIYKGYNNIEQLINAFKYMKGDFTKE